MDTLYIEKYRINFIIFLGFFLLHPLQVVKPVLPLGAENFPCVTVLSYSSYSIPFNSPFLQNLYPFFSSLSGSSFGFLPLNLPNHFRVSSSPILTTCPYHLSCAKSVISLRFCYICSKKPESKMEEA